MAGGTTIHTRALALALRGLGHEVHVVAAKAEGAPDEEEREGILVHRVRPSYTVWSALRTRRLLPDLDVVHGHGTCAYGHLRLNDFPTVVKMHSTWNAEVERYRSIEVPTTRLLAMRMYSRMDRYCARRGDHLICITEAVARETEMAYGVPRERMTVVHNGVDLKAFSDAAGEREAVREELGLEGLVVAYVGRLEPHKGVLDLLQATEGLGVQLLLVGDGSQRVDLEGRARELGLRAKFTGFVPHGEVPRMYAAADVVCHPSLYEPLGNVVLEAMAAGRPIVAVSSGGLAEVFEPGTGELVEPGEVGAIREALGRLLEDEAARGRAGRIGLETVGRYGWDTVAKVTIEVCEGVLATYSAD
jgi:glycogen(starch) synthase